MMMINDVMPTLWTKDHRDHVFTEKLLTFLCAFLTPTLPFGSYFTHPNGELRWTQV
jgi:hypothetical protein